MKYRITLKANFNTKESLADALEDLALQVKSSTQSPTEPGKSAGYMGAYCNHATVTCKHFNNP